jgi:hypothetical protein
MGLYSATQCESCFCALARRLEERGRWVGWLYLQSSNAKDGDQSNLLSAAKIQASDDWNRKDDQREVCDDVDSCVGAVGSISICAIFAGVGCTDNHIANWLMHEASSLVQKARTGMQANMLLRTVHMV